MGHYVALLDILGFKDIINNNPHDEIVRLFKNFRIYVQRSLAKNKTEIDNRGQLTYDVTETTINSNIISDSLVFWTNDDDTSGLFELIDCLQSFTSFCHNLPAIFLRGGISYGDFFYHNNGVIRGKNTIAVHPIMVGKALVDVYEIEKTLQVAGCIITDKAIREALQNNKDLFDQKLNEFISEKKIVKYDMPTKTDTIKCWTVNWVMDEPHPDLKEIKNGFLSFNKEIKNASVNAKIENTINYYKYIKKHIYKK